VSTSTSPASIARRAVRTSPAARAVVGSPPLRRAIGAQRAARVLRPAGRFLLGEARAGAAGCYRIKGTDLVVHLRHASRDIEIFVEIFAPGRMSYEPPPEVAAVLDARGPVRIADLGGNIGLFGLYALSRWPVASLRSYEPDPANAALLRATIAANRAGARWELEQVAVSAVDGKARFETGLLSESRLASGCHARHGAADGGQAATIDVAVLDLFAQPPADLLKIDIEGAEWAILGDPRLAEHPASAIVLEWHQRLCPGPKARHAARALLEVGGYEAIEQDRSTGDGAEREGSTAANGLMWGLRR
jgi:FkbM family methyltransferase